MPHSNSPSVFISSPTKNEVWIYDDAIPEVFTLPSNIAIASSSNFGSWRVWPGPPPNIGTGGGAGMGILGTTIYIIGGISNSR